MNNKAIGHNISVIRNARGWTQTSLAERMGCYPSSVSAHEKSGKMSFETMCKYAETLGCTVAQLLDGVTDIKDFHLDADIFAYYPWNLALAVMAGTKWKAIGYEATEEDRERAYRVYVPALLESMKNLTEREQRVLYMRFNNGMTLEQVGKELGVTRDRIRQIEAKALRKLRLPRYCRRWIMDTMDKALEAAEERDKLKLEVMALNHKLSAVYASLGLTEKQKEAAQKAEGYEEADPEIEDLELSVRSYNCLKRRCYNRLSDFKGKTMEDLIRIRNLGRKSLEEILARLKEHGYDFNDKGFLERQVLPK